MNGKETIVDKIRKLMAMADKNSGATEHEMATALSMAQALMMRHAIEEDEIKDRVAPGVNERTVRGKDAREFKPWMGNLAEASAKLNMCHALQSKHKVTKEMTFYFIGRPEATEAAELLFAQLIKETVRLFKMNMPKHLPWAERRRYRENFKFACSVRINQRVDRMLMEMRNDNAKAIAATGSTALVVATTMEQRFKEIADWVAETYPDMKEGRRTKGPSGHGLKEGYRAGDQAKIRDTVTS